METDDLMKGSWAQLETHPAVLAYLSKFAPDEETYPWGAEEMKPMIAALQRLPADGAYKVLYQDEDDDLYSNFWAGVINGQLAREDWGDDQGNLFLLWALPSGRAILHHDFDHGSGGAACFVIQQG